VASLAPLLQVHQAMDDFAFSAAEVAEVRLQSRTHASHQISAETLTLSRARLFPAAGQLGRC